MKKNTKKNKLHPELIRCNPVRECVVNISNRTKYKLMQLYKSA